MVIDKRNRLTKSGRVFRQEVSPQGKGPDASGMVGMVSRMQVVSQGVAVGFEIRF